MNLYVDIDTDRMKSTFTAIGLAQLFYELPPPGSGEKIRLLNQGSAYLIDVSYSPNEAMAYLARRNSQRLPPLIPAIKKKFSAKEQKQLQADPASAVQFKYVPQGFQPSDMIADYETQQGYLPAKKEKNAVHQEGDAQERDANYPLWAHLSSYFGKGSAMRDGYPNLLHSWHAHQGEAATALLKLILALYGSTPNDVETVQADWQATIQPLLTYRDYPISAMISSLAVVSPSTSKGLYSESAARGLSEDTPESFWLSFYFAFAGYIAAGMPFTLGSDVALYYPLPENIQIQPLKSVMKKYREQSATRRLYQFSNALPRIKLDVLAYLNYYRNIVAYFAEQRELGGLPKRLQAYGGLVGYYYKDAGGTQIPFDETVFALPLWLPRDAGQNALDAATTMLDDHYALIDRVRGKPPKNSMTGDELAVLSDYRQFITSGEKQAWVDFVIRYNHYRFSQMVDQPYLQPITSDLFTATLINIQEAQSVDDKQDYRQILTNRGFRNIANAIRYCTITTRYFSDVQKRNVSFKVRHGLGDDLLRQAHNSGTFVQTLSSFLHDYARESISVQANTGETRPFVTEDDINDLVGLIAEYGSPTVASLLVAVGYSSDYNRDSNKS